MSEESIASAALKRYRVVDVGGGWDAPALENFLNDAADEGWIVACAVGSHLVLMRFDQVMAQAARAGFDAVREEDAICVCGNPIMSRRGWCDTCDRRVER